MAFSDTPRARTRARVAALIGVALLLPALAGCQTAAEQTGAVYPAQYYERHPIVLADKPRVLDVFIDGSGLGPRQQQDVRAFVSEYGRYGKGPLVAQVPTGAVGDTSRALAALRSAVGGRISVSRYEPLDPRMASPIRLSFRRLQADVATQCGLWPQDLGVDTYAWSASNAEYWNFGCATQANLARQIADPVDLVRGRELGTPDAQKRLHSFDQLRQGNDPSTTYKTEAVLTGSK